MSDHVSITSEGDLAIVAIERPERRNALDAATAGAIADAIRDAGGSHRVVILTGSGGSFCAGGDLDELQAWSDEEPDAIADKLYGTFQSMICNIKDTDAVVIAAVGGPAVGAGMDLALACDLRIAAESARFGQVWVRLGVIPGTGGAYLTQMLAGSTKAAELLLTGELIPAPEALAAGLVNEVVPDDALLDAARETARRVLKHPAGGVVANKRAIVAAQRDAIESALDHARRVQPGRFTSEEFKAAVKEARSR